MPTRSSAARILAPALLASAPGLAAAVPYLPFLSPIDLLWLDAPYGLRLDGALASDRAGSSVASAGDVNGDGIEDLLIGARYADPASKSNAGRTYVVFGAASLAWTGPIQLATLNGANGFAINGIDANDQSGFAVSAAGDVNGDGFDDLIIGAPGVGDYYAGTEGRGAAYIVLGGPTVGASGFLELSGLNGASGFVCTGIDAYDRCGRAVAGAGDVNGDGYDDILIGAPGASPGGRSGAGESYIVFGGPTVGASGSVNLATLNGTNGFVCNGIDLGDASARPVAPAGDINGDGIDDFAIGATFADPGGRSNAGEAAIIFGAVGIGATGTLELSALNGSNGFIIAGIDPNDFSGDALAGGRDANGDGIDDLLIGAAYADPGGRSNAGETYLIFGGPAVGALGSVQLSTLNGANGCIIAGIAATDASGASIALTGDANDDGHADLVIGARFANPAARIDAGETYLLFGGPGFGASGAIELSAISAATGVVFHGADPFDAAGSAVASAGDVNDDGLHDFIIAAPSAAPDGRNSAGEISIILGRTTAPPPACPGDTNGDLFTNAADFVILASNFGASVTPNTSGDLSGDGLVNASDFVILAGDFGCAP